MSKIFRWKLALVGGLAVLGLGLLAQTSRADSDHEKREHEGRRQEASTSLPANPALAAGQKLYRQECSACHIAYPERLLPADSWKRLMGQLPTHFGSDASLDEASTRAIAGWLNAQAGSGKRVAGPIEQDRISRSPWFQREHREISAATWKRASIKSASNCQACHQGAAQGRFDEHEVKVPR